MVEATALSILFFPEIFKSSGFSASSLPNESDDFQVLVLLGEIFTSITYCLPLLLIHEDFK